MTSLIKSALWYGRYGWYVMPLHEPLFDDSGKCTGCTCEEWKREHITPDYVCKTPGKHPRHGKWEDVASDDHEQITKWWKAWPAANIGLACGKSGIVALDSDSYKEGGHKITYETVTSITGGGGEHLLFKHPEIVLKLGNSKSGLDAWIDVRGHGGMIVLAPSMHPSGTRYEWEPDYGPHEVTAVTLPDEIAGPLIKAAETAVTRPELSEGDMPDIDAYAPKLPGLLLSLLTDDRSKRDFWIVRGLLRAGMPDNEIYALYVHNDPTGKFSEKNGAGAGYLSTTIANARKHIEKFRQSLHIEEIAA